MSSSRIVVPIHLDALYVKERSQVVPPTADFDLLPYFDGRRDVHASVPFLGEQAATEPFSEKPCQLDKGIHLHWRFPRALTTGTQLPGGGVKFPPLPDRWLITRAQLIRGHHEIEGQWVIESNFLHPEGANVPASAYPVWAENRSQGRCFRYLGRCLTFQEWKSQTPQAGDYLTEPLTAVGYGEPSFAAFYPNCSSIFGFHDPQYADDIPQGVYYQVVGWNHTPNHDYLQILLAEENKHRRPAESRSVSLGNVLKQQLGWSIPVNPPVDASILCHGSLVFRTQSTPQWTPQLQNLKITFGATITEALSAYLAHEIVPQDAPNKEMLKAEIEDQLEAIMLDRTLNNRDLDLAAKFNEARHAKGFDEVYAGILWTVRAQSGETRDEDPEADIAPWPDVADKLYTLNRLQRAYNEAWDEIHATHRQIYSDWCRFMNCVYPQSNSINHLPSSAELRFHLEHSSMPRLKQKLVETGELVSPPGNPEGPLQASASSGEFSLAHLIQQELNALLSSLASHEAQTPGARYVVQPAVAPRFWRPTEPVILLAGKTVRVDEPAYMEDEDASGPLPCELIDGVADLERIVRLNPSRLLSRLTYNPREWREQPWHPFLLQWEVELTPFKALGNLTTADRNYDPKFITHNFTLLKSDVDLSPKSSARLTPNASSERARFVYQGSSLLTPHVASQFVNQLYSYIERLLQRQLTELQDEEDLYPGGVISGNGDEHSSRLRIDRMLGILNERPIQGLGPDTVARLRQVLQNLKKDDFFCLAQRLSGFNDALLMHRQTLQIPIDDPIGFSEIRNLASQVTAAVGDHAHSAPQPLQYFSPIRTGEIQVRRLRLVSTFGRKLDLTVDSLISATPMRPQAGGNSTNVFLPPRLVQPARLQFRWLAASAQDQSAQEREMHAHPDSTPICGWVIANHLDNNLFVYSGSGQALGYLEADSTPRVRWRPIPGSANPILRLDQIDNARLRQMAAFFLSGSTEYFQVFLTDLQDAQMRIEPQYCGDPLPMGQPLALVRATLSLDVQGPPALHQGWKEFQDNMASNRPDADNFDSVRFPIRLGEQNQLNDGLAVYWLEDTQGEYMNNEYVIPNYQTTVTDPQDKKCDFLYQAVSDPPLKVTMLFDPRGVVHAATGILPIKAIQIPPHQYSAALKEFEMAFLTAPVLAGKFTGTPGETIGLPVIDPPGYRWTWLEQRASGWTAPAIDAADLFTPFAGPTEIREGWLKLTRCEVKQKK